MSKHGGVSTEAEERQRGFFPEDAVRVNGLTRRDTKLNYRCLTLNNLLILLLPTSLDDNALEKNVAGVTNSGDSASPPLFSSLPSVKPSPHSLIVPAAMKRRSTIHHQRLEAVNDLTTLSPLSDDAIVSCIRERFLSDTIYTGISSSAVVVTNPHKYVTSNADSVLHKYAAEYRSISQDKEPLPPHIFQLANNAYYHMRRTTQDQSIILT